MKWRLPAARWTLRASLMLMILMLIGFYSCVPMPSPAMMIEAETRFLRYKVIDPNKAGINFTNGVHVHAGGVNGSQCYERGGLLEPFENNHVTYALFFDALRVTLDREEAEQARAEPIGKFLPHESADVVLLYDGARVIAGGSGNECGRRQAAMRLPVWGPAKLGEVLPEAVAGNARVDLGPLLLGATVRIYGRSFRLLDGPRRLFPADEITLPGGSRLQSLSEDRETAWWGLLVVDAEPVPERKEDTESPALYSFPKNAMSLSASTNARQLRLDRWGEDARTGEIIEIGYFAQIFNDPWYLRFQIIIIAVVALLQFALTVLQLWREPDEDAWDD